MSAIRARVDSFCRRFGLELPILLAPMAGASAPALSIAVMHAGGLVGSPETIRRKLRKFEQSHVDQVILLNQAGKNTHEDICASLDLFASEVMPEFQAREPEHQQWKDAVLAGAIELDEVDTAPEKLPRPQRRPIETPG